MLPLAPGESQRIDVTFRPTSPGRYNVNIDACIDDASSYIERFHDLHVLPANSRE